MNWDDLKYILAVARAGTISGGAQQLGVNATTVSRRLRSLEERAGTALFDKLKHGAVLTTAGQEMVAVAETVEELTNELDARIHGLDTRLEGSLRLTSVGFLFIRWLKDFGDFARRYPGIDLELTSSIAVANLTMREADVAIRVAQTAPPYLVGWKYARMHFAAYASNDLISVVGNDAAYEAFPWVGWDLSVARATDLWLEQHAPRGQIKLRVEQMSLMYQALVDGVGASILPCVIGDSSPLLRRIGPYLEPGDYIWILTHPQLRKTARVTTLMAYVRELIARDLDLIEGRAPRSA